MSYSLGKAATEAEELRLAAQKAAELAALKAPTEAEQIVRDAQRAALLSIPEAPITAAELTRRTAAANLVGTRLPAAVAAQMAADRAAAAQAAVVRTAGGMSTGTKVAIGVGAAVAVAGIAYAVTRKPAAPTLMVKNRRRKSSRPLRSNPPISVAMFKSIVRKDEDGELSVSHEGLRKLLDASGSFTLEDGREFDSEENYRYGGYQLFERGTPEHAAFVAKREEQEEAEQKALKRRAKGVAWEGSRPTVVEVFDRMCDYGLRLPATVTRVVGDLDLSHYEYPLPPGLKSVEGTVMLEDYKLPLPSGLSEVGGALYVWDYPHPLPAGLVSVGKSFDDGLRNAVLDLSGYRFPLPAGLTVENGYIQDHDYPYPVPDVTEPDYSDDPLGRDQDW